MPRSIGLHHAGSSHLHSALRSAVGGVAACALSAAQSIRSSSDAARTVWFHHRPAVQWRLRYSALYRQRDGGLRQGARTQAQGRGGQADRARTIGMDTPLEQHVGHRLNGCQPSKQLRPAEVWVLIVVPFAVRVSDVARATENAQHRRVHCLVEIPIRTDQRAAVEPPGCNARIARRCPQPSTCRTKTPLAATFVGCAGPLHTARRGCTYRRRDRADAAARTAWVSTAAGCAISRDRAGSKAGRPPAQADRVTSGPGGVEGRPGRLGKIRRGRA